MKKAYPYVLCVLLAIAGSLGSLYLGPGVRAGAATASGLLSLRDVTTALTAGGFRLEENAGSASATLELGGVSPHAYSVANTQDILYIYVFQTVDDRIRAEDSDGANQLRKSLTTGSFMPSFFPAKNTLLVYTVPFRITDLGQLEIVNRRLQSLREIVFTRLNNGQVLVFRGEGADWKAEVVYRYYEYWWRDSSGMLQYENGDLEHSILIYKGSDLKNAAPIQFKYNFEGSAESFDFGGEDATDKNGFADLGGGSGSGMALLRAGDTIEATIKWNGCKESFALSDVSANYSDRYLSEW